MKTAVKLFTVLIFVFTVLLSVGASVGGIIGELITYAAYLLPVVIGYLASRKMKYEREEQRGHYEAEATLLGMSRDTASVFVPTMIPTVAIAFLISFLVSLLLGSFGFESPTVEDAPLVKMLVVHALLPAVLEELLFRYLPMKLLLPYSRRWCIILSSLYFAFVHMSLFQIPYALFAGVIFIAVDIMCNSVLPSMIIHLVNNTASVLWIKYSGDSGFAVIYCAVLVLAALLSLVPFFTERKSYAERLKLLFDVGEGVGDTYSPIILIGFCSIMAAINLVS